MSDVLLFQSPDDGEITVANGQVKLTDGTETAVYLSLFGGNHDGSDWWGNTLENQPERKLQSETQRLLETLSLTTANMQRIADAVALDLSWMNPKPEITVTMPRLNTIQITVNNLELTYES